MSSLPELLARVPLMLQIFAGTAVFFFLVERLWPLRRRQGIFRRGFIADVLYVGIHYGLRVSINFFLADLLTRVGRHLFPEGRGLLAELPVAVQAAVILLVLDFLFYVMHRLKHRWHWWWRLHETHHSSVDLDFLASVRFHPVEKLLDRLVFLLPLTAFGASESALLVWSAVDVFFGMLNHSNTRLRLGALVYVLVGPEMHRWHHARQPGVREVNFGNNLSIFDWIFGTAALPSGEPEEFGIDDQEAYPQDNLVAQWLFAFRPRLTPREAPPWDRREMRGEPEAR